MPYMPALDNLHKAFSKVVYYSYVQCCLESCEGSFMWQYCILILKASKNEKILIFDAHNHEKGIKKLEKQKI